MIEHVLVATVLVDVELDFTVVFQVVDDEKMDDLLVEVDFVAAEVAVVAAALFIQEHALETREEPHVDGIYVGKPMVTVCV